MFALLVAGSRTFDDASLLYNKLDFYLQGREEVLIVHGGARGADSLANQYAKDRNFKTKVFLPNWERYGKKAGILRNIEMFEYISKFSDNSQAVIDELTFELEEDYSLSDGFVVLGVEFKDRLCI